MKAAIRRVFGKLGKLMCVRASDEDETAPAVVEDEMRATDQLALTQLFARRDVTWPGRQKPDDQQKHRMSRVKLLNLYPDLSEFYETKKRMAGGKSCAWKEWGDWNGCSATCGAGVTQRHRKQWASGCDILDSVESYQCNDRCCVDCTIDGVEYKAGEMISNTTCEKCICTASGIKKCLPKPEANVDGGLSPWSDWGNCTQTCEGGMTSRTRYCNSPLPRCSGHLCTGPFFQNDNTCNDGVSCCETSVWDNWSPCSVTCGPGTMTHTRTFVNLSDNQSSHCLAISLHETDTCTEYTCTADCNLGDWSDWSICSAQCGAGTQSRTRTILPELPLTCYDFPTSDTQTCVSVDCECDPPMMWSNNSLCHGQRCDDMTTPANCWQQWEPACVCPANMYLHNGICVPLQDCYACDYNGETKNNGEIWFPTRSCDVCLCVKGEVTCQSNVEIPTCPTGFEVTYYDGPCEPKCTRMKDACQLQNRTSVLAFGNGYSSEETQYQVCSGSCPESKTTPKLVNNPNKPPTHSLESECTCCTGVISGHKPVLVTRIKNNGAEQHKTVYLPLLSDCDCNPCRGI